MTHTFYSILMTMGKLDDDFGLKVRKSANVLNRVSIYNPNES